MLTVQRHWKIHFLLSIVSFVKKNKCENPSFSFLLILFLLLFFFLINSQVVFDDLPDDEDETRKGFCMPWIK
jgi:hypothetical protein